MPHQLDQAGQVVDVLGDLPDGFDDDRESGVVAGHLEQLGGALALLPQRCPPAWVAARQQQGPGGALAEPAGEQRGAADLLGDDVDHLVRVGEQQFRQPVGGLGVGQPQHDPVVRHHRLDVHAGCPRQGLGHHQRPSAQHPPAQGGVDDHPPVTELVAEAFDDHCPVVR